MPPRTPANVKSPPTKTPASEEDSLSKQIRTTMEQLSDRVFLILICLILKKIFSKKTQRVQPKHQKVNESMRAIRSQGVRLLGPGSKISHNSRAKLIALYQTAQRQCESENAHLQAMLANIQVTFFFLF